ncbi:retropepsin-like aspartic protease family protein [Paracoccus seriniphilus]|uniref:Aspartyl protease family protein n=1 Tax=Paracoccus seriniphilus TaxID=184748 RepID=A0A239PVQ0_9RHOB|nr:TIGR02281 family clan AA aspartic protease [Paracoccus seriniphilus]WCR13380.1 TIGR02281 family clan AA aspartic protease [Paracoccus seriniphilus]SNT74374.1 aspartyl protease family protein [Paracoccus seriniphilus]
MATDDGMRLAYYIVLLVVIGGAVLFELSGRGSKALRQLGLWVVIFAGAFFASELWMNGGLSGQRQMVTSGGRIEIPASRDGHFHLTAQLNGVPVRFIVDTGASSIALGPEDARRIGIDTGDLAYIGTAMTANGQVKTAPVTIDELAIGDILDRNVRAWVIDGDLDGSLLGMSYLRTFARVSFESDLLILQR